MKTNKFLVIVLGAVLLFGGCKDQYPEREPSPEFKGVADVFFPTTSFTKEYDPADGITSAKIAISRKDSVGELSVPIVVLQNDSDIFTLPDTVKFADKVKTDTITINFPGGKEAINYTLKMAVKSDLVNPYSSTVSECTFSFINLAWTSAPSSCVWEDNSWNGFFGSSFPTQVWYVKYQYVKLSDGSKKYRFLNPYASHPSTFDPVTETSTPDRYGVYDGFPSNYPGDYDAEGTYNAIASVTPEGKVSWATFNTGVNWSEMGQFIVGNVLVAYPTLSEDDYPLGEEKDGVITFPDNSMFLYIPYYASYGALPGGSCTITFDSAAYCQAHAIKKISDFEDKFNDQTEMEWTDSVAETSLFQSAAFEQSWNQVLRKAVDIDSINGDKSEFKNLWSFADLYAEGYCLAFYWNQEKGKITIPADQPTGQKYAGKKILMGPSSTDCTIEEVIVSGTPLTKFTFGIALTTEDGNLIGEYEEVFYIGEQINWSVDSYVGAFEVNEKYIFDDSDWTDTIAISKIDENTALIEGFDYCSGLTATFDDETKTLSLAPQTQDSISGVFDIFFLTLNATTGYPSETESIVLQMNMDGTISYAPTTGAYGYVLYSEAYAEYYPTTNGYLDGYYDQTFTPIEIEPEEAPARKMMASKSSIKKHGAIKRCVHKAGKNLSTKGFRIQGKAPRFFLHKNIVPMF